MSPATYTSVEDFKAKRVVAAQSGCWVVQGAGNHHGYHSVMVAGETHRAHRWVYEQLVGPIPDGLEMDHLCRNPPCCNPDHLEPVTHAENMRRRRLGACSRGHQLNDAYVRPSGGRSCRPCANRRAAEYKARLRAEAPPNERLLSDEAKADILANYTPGLNRWQRGNATELAVRHGVTRRTISRLWAEQLGDSA